MAVGGLQELINPEVTDPELQDKDPEFAHIVGPLYTDEGKVSAATRITEALVMGTPLEALCGYLFVPSKDPSNLPVCDRCKALTGDRVGGFE
jgi:hypothetical protein